MPVPPESALVISDLCKTYRARDGSGLRAALKNVSFAVPRGSMFALLGPNGAGKSTLINIMAGLVSKTAGSVTIWGHDIDADGRQARRAIGVVPQELNLDPFFTPRETLDVQAGYYGIPRAERRTDEILETVGLADKADAYARTLSGGMRRRLLIAKAMVHNPEILVLDEPTAGVDVELRQHLWQTIGEMNAHGRTILLTTHYLEEAQDNCETIAILRHGELVACEPRERLLSRLTEKLVKVRFAADLAAPPQALEAFLPQAADARTLVFRVQRGDGAVAALLSALTGCGAAVEDISTVEPDLEDVFLRLTRDETPATVPI
ncbi:ABC transporter ATP-binding protein [Oleispirillum naphthae]|uniref:ABC transporter ATP-binding protein n=1 Tax=Oleispirillum naphthae TaxID=2838853 RepID=UPI00308267F9